MYSNELNRLKKGIPSELWELLTDRGCIIAGGAITSMFTNSEVNDYDIYFRSKEDFTKVFQEVYCDWYDKYKDCEYGLWFRGGIASVVTKKALLMFNGESKIQFIVNDFYETPEQIFEHFDFTVCMGALVMKDEQFIFHNDFMKHNAQKYLSFNPKTLYPLVSALRVSKYNNKGYSISKAQMLRVLLAVNAKNIDSWEKLIDELGGMYGTPPEEIFDTSKEFDIHEAIETLESVVITEKMLPNCSQGAKEIASIIRHAFTDEYLGNVGVLGEVEHDSKPDMEEDINF